MPGKDSIEAMRKFIATRHDRDTVTVTVESIESMLLYIDTLEQKLKG